MPETTVSMHTGRDVALAHNNREEAFVKGEKHIDPNGHHVTVISQTEEEAYAELFGEAIEEYNAKQKRADRRLTVASYLEKVKQDTRGKANKAVTRKNEREGTDDKAKGKASSYEVICTIGNSSSAVDDQGRRIYDNGHRVMPYRIPDDIAEKILLEYADTWSSRNPHLKLFNCNLHADEYFEDSVTGEKIFSTPHIHADFIPWADGYKQGLGVQSSIGKALNQQGCKDWVAWQERERAYMESLIKKYLPNYTIVHPCKDKHVEGVGIGLYKERERLKDEIESLQSDYDELSDDYDALDVEHEELADMVKSNKKTVDKLKADVYKEKMNAYAESEMNSYALEVRDGLPSALEVKDRIDDAIASLDSDFVEKCKQHYIRAKDGTRRSYYDVIAAELQRELHTQVEKEYVPAVSALPQNNPVKDRKLQEVEQRRQIDTANIGRHVTELEDELQ